MVESCELKISDNRQQTTDNLSQTTITMKRLLLTIFSASALFAKAQTPPAFTDIPPSKILVVYNNNSIPDNSYSARDYNGNNINDSKELAEYYQQKRGIPASNMLGLNPTWFEVYQINGWKSFFWDEMLVPIRNKIYSLGDTSIYYILLMEGTYSSAYLGDTIHTSQDTRSLDNALVTMDDIGTRTEPQFPYYWEYNPVQEVSPGKSVDLGQFNHNYNVNGVNMYLVCRITSWNLDLEKNMIDMALYGDKYINLNSGYYNGLGYVDTRYGVYDSTTLVNGSPYYYNTYAAADKGIAMVENIFKKKGVKYKYEATGDEIGGASAVYTDASSADSAKNTMLYGGWYNYGKYNNKWEWIPGALACDLNSASATYLSYPSLYWLSNAFSQGLTCGTGVYSEPYANGHSRADALMYYFLNGYNFIESAYKAEPSLKWMGAVIGDPLYNPFKVGKPAVKDLSIEPSTVSYDFLNDSSTNVHLDYNVTIANPEVVKAQLYWGLSTAYTDTMHSDSIHFAHHTFKMRKLLANTTYHYQICVVDPVGNTWCSLDQLFKTDGTFSVGMDEYASNNNFISVYPNPGKGDFKIVFDVIRNEEITIAVFNSLGQEVYSERTYQNPGSYVRGLNLTCISAGVYTVKISSNSFIKFRKLTIE